MATYTRSGRIHGRFSKARSDKYDKLGRMTSKDFFSAFGWNLQDNDRPNGELEYDRTDQVARKKTAEIFVESAVKSTRLWKFIRAGFDNGVDVETRKYKYLKEGERAYVCMSNDEADEILLIPMLCLEMAEAACGEEFKGQGDIKSTGQFKMPSHGCHRVRKRCRRGYEQNGEPEDFYRIPYEFVARFKKINGKWVQTHKPEKDPYGKNTISVD